MLGGVTFFRSRWTRLQKAVFKVRQSFTGHGRLVILLTKLARELLRRGAGARTSVNADKTKKQKNRGGRSQRPVWEAVACRGQS